MRRRRRLKAVLLATMATSSLAWFTVPSVWAVFSAETRSLPSTAATGTLTFELRAAIGTDTPSVCKTKDGPATPGNVNTSCTALMPYDATRENYPGVTRTVKVTITNSGSVPASDLSLFAPVACTAANTPDAPVADIGTGDPCASDQISVQETQSDFTTNVKCYWPTTGTTCASSSLNVNNFITNFPSAALGLDLGAGPTAQQSRYFLVGLTVPSTATNATQAREAVFSLAWHMTS